MESEKENFFSFTLLTLIFGTGENDNDLANACMYVEQ